MTQPTAEARLAAWVAYEALAGRYDVQPIVDAVWSLAVAEGRRLEAERLTSLIQAAKAWRRAQGAYWADDHWRTVDALAVAVDALTREDT